MLKYMSFYVKFGWRVIEVFLIRKLKELSGKGYLVRKIIKELGKNIFEKNRWKLKILNRKEYFFFLDLFKCNLYLFCF